MRKPKAGSKWFSRPSTVCRLCGHAAGDSVQEVEEHTAACLGSGGNTELQLFSVEDERQVFRLVFAAKPTATFEDLDQALRRHWMECCGHLRSGEDSGRERLSQRLGQERLVASYAYDFGSTTVVLVIAGPKVSVRPAAASRLFAGGARLALVARNERPQVPCCECGKPALYILNEGSNFEDKEYGHFWCSRACAHRSHYDSYLISHFWNSPQSGVCGYDGPEQPEEGEDLWGDDSSSSEEEDEESGSSSEDEAEEEEEEESSEDEEEEEESSEDEEEEEEQQQQQPQRRGGGAGRGAAAGGTAKKAAAAAKPAVGKKAAAAAKPAAGKKAAAAKPAASKKATAAKTKAGGKAAPKPAAKQAASPAAKGRAAAGRGKGRAASGGGKGRAAAGPAAKKPAAGAKGKAAAGTKRQAAAAAPTSRSKRAK
ncbi:hypothetical protein ABPG75_001525 [Micractinium tetrahymenae]